MQGSLEELERRLGADWKHLRAARAKTDAMLGRLKAELLDLANPDCAVIVTGSLGRGEAGDDSDADWILLVDGPSDPAHASLTLAVEERISRVVRKQPGRTGTFGAIVASHELVHYIAGTRDTNENLTRRVLLLTESRALTNPELRDRVLRNLLVRYVVQDRAVGNKTGTFHPIPHFLLNDVIRYWRTVATDYASKMWERRREGWGIRNIKLRFSRKMLFVWGLLASFSGSLFPTDELRAATTEDEFLKLLAELIREQTNVSPLEILARVCLSPHVKPATALDVFSSYDAFLGALSDPEVRRRLETARFENAADDETFAGLRQASSRFRKGINAIFFDEHPVLADLVRMNAVF